MAVPQKDLNIELTIEQMTVDESLTGTVDATKKPGARIYKLIIGSLYKLLGLPSNDTSTSSNAQNPTGYLNYWASMPYQVRLGHFIDQASIYSTDGKVTTLDFRPLYAVNIYHLQHLIVNEIGLIKKAGEVSENQLRKLQKLIKHYSKSMTSFVALCFTAWTIALL